MPKNTPILVVGPSGAGKSTLVDELRNDPTITIAETVTTRPQRTAVKDTDRHFVSELKFDEMEKQNLFQIVVPFAGHRYGFLAPNNPNNTLIIIYKVEGLRLLANLYSDFRIVAIEAPIDVLEQRLIQRKTPERFHRDELLREITAGRDAADLVIDTAEPLRECVSVLQLFIAQQSL